jgi:HK97 family phage prohead protease
MTHENPQLPDMLGTVQTRVSAVDDARSILDVRRVDADGRRIYRALAYDTTTTDRHGTTMTPDALKLTEAGVPVLLFHNREAFPVAKVVEWTITDRGPEAGFVFADTDQARTAETLVAGGFLRGVSVGFIARDGYVNDAGTVVFTDAELVELSLTPTPSSRGALVDLRRSIDDLVGTPTDAPQTPSEAPVSDERADAVSEAHIELDTAENAATDTECRATADCSCGCDVLNGSGEDEPEFDGTPAQTAATVDTETARRIRTISLINRSR